MYEIYAYPYGNPDVEYLIYQPGNRSALVLSPKLTREVSKGGSLSFTMPRDHQYYENLQKLSTVVTVKQDGKEIWRGRVLSHEADWYNRRVVYCEGALSYFNDSCITPFAWNKTLSGFLAQLIEIHNSQVQQKMKMFELGTVIAALGNLTVNFGDKDEYGQGEDYGSIWEIISKMVLETFGGYMYCTYNSETGMNVLNYCDSNVDEGRLVSQKIEYGVNLLDLTEKTDASDLYTRIYPIGNKHTITKTRWKWKFLIWGEKEEESHEERYGIMDTDAATITKYLPSTGYSYNLEYGWIQNDTAAKKFGIISKICEVDADSSNDTFALGVQQLQQNYSMSTSITIKAVDLVDAGYDTDRLTFACFAHIISKPHSVDSIMLCSKLVEQLDRPDKKEYSFGMTRKTLTDRQVVNMGKTNTLHEKSSTATSSSGDLLKKLNDYKTSNNIAVQNVSTKANGAQKTADTATTKADGAQKTADNAVIEAAKANGKAEAAQKAADGAQSAADEAAKTATNFLSFNETDGMIVGCEQIKNKKVQITNDAIKVMSGGNMVKITSDSISITDGEGSCTINSGEITFCGIKNNIVLFQNEATTYTAQEYSIDLSKYSAVLVTFRSNKNGTWFSGGGNAGLASMIVPVNGIEMSMIYPWNTVHKRSIAAYSDKIVFGTGYERTSQYTPGGSSYLGIVATTFALAEPTSDGWNTDDTKCVPYIIYGFM